MSKLFFFDGTDKDPVRVRVPGAQVNANKADSGDRPCILVIAHGVETLVHEVQWGDSFAPGLVPGRLAPHGRITQDFVNKCPVTGAVIWLELVGLVTATVRPQPKPAEAKPTGPCIGCGGSR